MKYEITLIAVAVLQKHYISSLHDVTRQKKMLFFKKVLHPLFIHNCVTELYHYFVAAKYDKHNYHKLD